MTRVTVNLMETSCKEERGRRSRSRSVKDQGGFGEEVGGGMSSRATEGRDGGCDVSEREYGN